MDRTGCKLTSKRHQQRLHLFKHAFTAGHHMDRLLHGHYQLLPQQ